MFHAQKRIEVRWILADDTRMIANVKSKMVVNCKKCGPRKAGLRALPWRDTCSLEYSRALSPPSASGYVRYWWGYAWLWFWILFASLCNNLSYPIHISFWNDRNTPISTEIRQLLSMECKSWWGDTGNIITDIVKFVVNFRPRVDFLGWFLIFGK